MPQDHIQRWIVVLWLQLKSPNHGLEFKYKINDLRREID